MSRHPDTRGALVASLISDAYYRQAKTPTEYARLWSAGRDGWLGQKGEVRHRAARYRVERAWESLVYEAMELMTESGRHPRSTLARRAPKQWRKIWRQGPPDVDLFDAAAPTLKEVREWFVAQGEAWAADDFFERSTALKWHTGSGEKITRWRGAAAAWLQEARRRRKEDEEKEARPPDPTNLPADVIGSLLRIEVDVYLSETAGLKEKHFIKHETRRGPVWTLTHEGQQIIRTARQSSSEQPPPTPSKPANGSPEKPSTSGRSSTGNDAGKP